MIFLVRSLVRCPFLLYMVSCDSAVFLGEGGRKFQYTRETDQNYYAYVFFGVRRSSPGSTSRRRREDFTVVTYLLRWGDGFTVEGDLGCDLGLLHEVRK